LGELQGNKIKVFSKAATNQQLPFTIPQHFFVTQSVCESHILALGRVVHKLLLTLHRLCVAHEPESFIRP
jgi:hypothetical protein